MSLEFSRRSFLKYTAVAAVAVAGSSLLTGCKDNPYQPTGDIGDTLKIMGNFTLNSAAYENNTLTCNMTFKCTSNNGLFVRPSSFQIEVIDSDDNKTIYRANQAQNNGVSLDTTTGDLEKDDEYTTNLIVRNITVADGDTIKVKYWPRDQASSGNLAYTRAFATWEMTYKDGALK